MKSKSRRNFAMSSTEKVLFLQNKKNEILSERFRSLYNTDLQSATQVHYTKQKISRN